MDLTLNKLAVDQLVNLLRDFPLSGWQVGGLALSSTLAYQIYRLLKLIIQPYRTPLKILPGPPKTESLLFGNILPSAGSTPSAQREKWFAEYGSTIQYRGLFNARRLCTRDPRALAYILSHAYDFPKPEFMQTGVSDVLGQGLVFSEGETHRRMRKVMNPCFSMAQIRGMMPIFLAKSFELTDVWLKLANEKPNEAINVVPWFSRATLDIIGEAGFDYQFNSLSEGEGNELCQAFMASTAPTKRFPILMFLANRWPWLKYIPSEQRRLVKHSRAVIERVGYKLIADKKASVLAQGSMEKQDVIGGDILTALIKANMATDVKESERMSDREVLDQICTMLIGGHETTASSLSWTLYDLAKPQYIHIQNRLREELLSVPSDTPTLDELIALPYLDAVVRETMRKNNAVDGTIREASRDAVIPLSRPVVGTDGVERNEIRIMKGDTIFIPVSSVNKDEETWGEDAREFRPERWLHGPIGHNDLLGVYSNQFTFLHGVRACIGYRVAIIEFKVILFTLIRNMIFELPEPELKIEAKSVVVTRPVIKLADGSLQSCMPLIIKPASTVF